MDLAVIQLKDSHIFFIFSTPCWVGCRTNSLTSTRHQDDLGYIRIWAPPNNLTFWDGTPSHYKWYQSYAPNLLVWVGGVWSPSSVYEWCLIPDGHKKGALMGIYEASWTLEDLAVVLMLHMLVLLHIRRGIYVPSGKFWSRWNIWSCTHRLGMKMILGI